MNLLETIINYYHGETKHGLWMAFMGGLLLIGSFMFWKWAAPLSLLKGYSVPMLLFGLLVGVGGAADGVYTHKASSAKIVLYQKDSTTFLKQEKVKTEKTHRGWHGIRILWGVLGLSGVLLFLFIRQPFWIGAGLGTVALTILISVFEFYSMRFNERYYHAIQSASVEKVNTKVQEIHTEAQQQENTPQTTNESQVTEQTHTRSGNDILLSQMRHIDSLQCLPALGITAVAVKDLANSNIPDSLPNQALTNEVGPIYPNYKKKEVLDYYNSGLIQTNGVNAKHCWFSKKVH
ncbi:hypothetical protein QFZ20_001544 [Flavobacterium sp. W4I14]|nr:hypothetical protein [Flavobacterium sp. W4I14]